MYGREGSVRERSETTHRLINIPGDGRRCQALRTCRRSSCPDAGMRHMCVHSRSPLGTEYAAYGTPPGRAPHAPTLYMVCVTCVYTHTYAACGTPPGRPPHAPMLYVLHIYIYIYIYYLLYIYVCVRVYVFVCICVCVCVDTSLLTTTFPIWRLMDWGRFFSFAANAALLTDTCGEGARFDAASAYIVYNVCVYVCVCVCVCV